MCSIPAALVATALVVFATGCTGPPSVPVSEPVSPAATQTAEAGPAPLSSIKIEAVPVAGGFEQPLFVTHAGDGSGRLFVVEQSGLVRVVRDGEVAAGEFLDVRSLITSGGERGLLGLAFAPDFETTGQFYVNYTNTNGDTVVARFTAEDPASDTPKLTGPTILLQVKQPYANHNGGCIAFDSDGLLWVGMGDGGSGGDPQGNAQNARSPLGKMLTIDVTAKAQKPIARVVGVRNPWRYSFDRKTGDLWIADVGQNAWEEIDVLRVNEIAGTNLGWNTWEGTHPYPEGTTPSRTGFTFPLTEYSHRVGESITGGYVYRGSARPELDGAYFYADFAAGWVAALRASDASGTEPARVLEKRVVLRKAGAPSSFGEDEKGEIYLCDYASGTVFALTAP